MGDLPYSSSKAGSGREKEIRAVLRSVGASAIGFMVDDDADAVIAQFRLQGREITVPVSVGAYEAAWLRSNRCGPRTDAKTHKARARAQAEIAVWGVLADWIKAQSAMMMCGFPCKRPALFPTSIIPGKLREHSRKPEWPLDVIDARFPDMRKLELNARRQRKGWATWGNETDKFESVQ